MIRSLIFILCAIAALALLIATIGAVFAMITGHIRWIELAWLSIGIFARDSGQRDLAVGWKGRALGSAVTVLQVRIAGFPASNLLCRHPGVSHFLMSTWVTTGVA